MWLVDHENGRVTVNEAKRSKHQKYPSKPHPLHKKRHTKKKHAAKK
jgi:hypothetical protein